MILHPEVARGDIADPDAGGECQSHNDRVIGKRERLHQKINRHRQQCPPGAGHEADQSGTEAEGDEVNRVAPDRG